jgi:hypothetical protein
LNPESAVPDPSSPGEEPNGLPIDSQVPPEIEQAQSAFLCALPELLQRCPGQWVAYHGARQIGFGQTKTDLYQKCFALGLKRGQCVVRRIQPQIDVIALDPRMVE